MPLWLNWFGLQFATAIREHCDASGLPLNDSRCRKRSFDASSATGSVEAEVTPRIGIIGQVSIDHRDYNNDTTLSSDGQTYLGGVALHLTDLIEGRITVGGAQLLGGLL